jgi:hypothetical protein
LNIFSCIYCLLKIEIYGEKDVRDQLGVVVHAYNPSTREAKAGGSFVHGQTGLHSETMSQKTKQNKANKYVRFHMAKAPLL